MPSEIQQLLNEMRLEVDVTSGAIDPAEVALLPKVVAAVDGQPRLVVCRGFDNPKDWENHMTPEDCERNRLTSEAFLKDQGVVPEPKKPERIITEFDVPPQSISVRRPFQSLTRRFRIRL